jgi:hypothetical protein
MFSQAFTSLTPSGYLEMQDCDFPAISKDSSLTSTDLGTWYTSIVAGSVATGRDLGIAKNYKRWMEELALLMYRRRCFAGRLIRGRKMRI